MKRVTYPTQCNCLSHLAKILNPLPPDIVCNCMGPVETTQQLEDERVMKTTSLASSSIKCICEKVVSENEEKFVSACDVGQPFLPQKTSVRSVEPYPQAKTMGFSACKCTFERMPDTPTCICGSRCPLRQEIPTKEVERIPDVSACTCSGISDIPTRETERISDVSGCTCSIQSRLTDAKQKISMGETERTSDVTECICSFQSRLTDDRQKIPMKELERISDVSGCSCSFESLLSDTKQKISTKETERTSDISACSCSFESRLTDTKQIVPTKELDSRPTDTNVCICNSECPFRKLNFEDMSLSSTYSQDLMYVDRIKVMIQKEKSLKQEIQELEHTEKAYTDKLKELNEMNGNAEGKQGFSIQNLYLENQKLEADNKNLEDQIKDVKLEFKQVRENVEGPLKRELEREKRNCEQIENEIRDLASKQSNVESNGRKEIELVFKQVESAKRNINDLQLVNKRLREEVCVLSCKCNEMQNELIKQKLGELRKLSAKKKRQRSSCICNNDTAIPNEELEAIAKNLSQLLREAEQCSTCKTANPDVVDTVKCIKDLVNVVKPNKDKNKDCTCADDKSSGRR